MGLSRDPIARGRQLANLTAAPPAPESGNRRAEVHGGYARVARERLDAKVLELVDALGEDLPLRAPGDTAMVRLLAEVLCRLDSVGEWLTLNGILGPDGEPRIAVMELERKLRGEASDHVEALGLSPRARVRLHIDVAHASLDAATALSAAREEPDPAIRRGLLEAAGLIAPEVPDA